ncbi:DegQ family serine endoprotease [Simiduia agarivorans]|uniref:Probable periplasmic serine endoprotease DegP-like n=1 Tax=Simiduia agarivorans (strain DSM 21679 / JCM 13881 / BCRC 17597 / SA1) TaxID=1117647 RepID=K4KFM6_SIMAS|nr:DegQ family serine endoprotease [Simiduia agarivorans]AFU97879.1 serine protease HtrA/DegQ/DegS family protein [Simiduia agarivorans SA1 = DSM 21679]
MHFKGLLLSILVLCAFAVPSQARSLPDFTQLIEETSPAVVKINTLEHAKRNSQRQMPPQNIPEIFRHLFEMPEQRQREQRSMGSGFIVSTDGYILTNHHVIDGADEIAVRLTDHREFEASVVGTDSRSDLALLKVDAKGLPALKFADSDKLKVGEWVLAIGSPFGLDFTASAGIVSAIGRSIPTERNENYVPFIQTDVAINPGNSGGPLFNLDGLVVGINSQIYTRSGGSIGLSFAIPANVARDVIRQLKEKGRVDRGWLGVAIQEVDRNLAQSFGLSKPAGALIQQIEPGSPADNSGLKVGDVILKFDGKAIERSGDLPHVVGLLPPGSKVKAEVMRAGKRKTVSVTVGKLPVGDEPHVASGPDASQGDRLGLVVEALDDRQKQAWRLDGGVLVTQVAPDSPAAAAGIRPGDVIAQLGFEPVTDVDTYQQLQAELPEDTLLPIRFYRDGRPAYRSFMIKK